MNAVSSLTLNYCVLYIYLFVSRSFGSERLILILPGLMCVFKCLYLCVHASSFTTHATLEYNSPCKQEVKLGTSCGFSNQTLPFHYIVCVSTPLCACVCVYVLLASCGGQLVSSTGRVAIKTSNSSGRQTVDAMGEKSASTPDETRNEGNQSFAMLPCLSSSNVLYHHEHLTLCVYVCVCLLFSCQSSDTQRGRGWLLFSK